MHSAEPHRRLIVTVHVFGLRIQVAQQRHLVEKMLRALKLPGISGHLLHILNPSLCIIKSSFRVPQVKLVHKHVKQRGGMHALRFCIQLKQSPQAGPTFSRPNPQPLFDQLTLRGVR